MRWQKDIKPTIIGAGVAGLTSALALAHKGIASVVLESRDKLAEVGAGLQLASNATRLLDRWGVLPDLLKVGVEPHYLELRDGLKFIDRVHVDLTDVAQRRWHAPYMTIHRADLQNVLYSAATKNPLIEIRLGEKVVDVTKTTSQSVSIKSVAQDEPNTFETPLVIACDGVWSKVRQTAPLDDHAKFSGFIAWRATIAVDSLPENFTRSLSDIATVSAWMGPNNHFVAYPINAGKAFNFVAITTGSNPGAVWSRDGDKTVLLKHFSNWHPTIREIIETVDNWTYWPLFGMVPHRFWDGDLRVFLGDASHGFLPFAAQGAAMAIEDSAVLAEVLSMDQLPLSKALDIFSKIRSERVSAVDKRGAFNRFVYHATGPVALARNFVMKTRPAESFMSSLDWLYDYDATALVKPFSQTATKSD